MEERKIDVNKASVEVLEKLKGVGRAKAESIVTTREGLGVFQNIEDILQVPGIGRNLLEQNRDTLVCSLPNTPPIPQNNMLRRSLRRNNAATTEQQQQQRSKTESNGIKSRNFASGGSSLYGGRGSRSAKVNETDSEKKDDRTLNIEEEGHIAEDEVDSRQESQCSSNLKDIMLVFQRSGNNSNNTSNSKSNTNYNRSRFRCDNSGSDTPHEEGASEGDASHEEGISSETPLDVPLSPMRITDDGDMEVENEEDETEEGFDNKIVAVSSVEEEEDMLDISDERKTSKNIPDKKQNKRKSEVCSDVKGTCPVKKSCKAVDNSDSCERIKPSSHISHKFSPPAGLRAWLSKYQSWNQSQKLFALDSLIDICDLSQVRHIHQTILPQFQRDFISLLPKELALYVLSFLEPKDLLRAAQTCKYWNILAADNLLWREKCREAGLEDHLLVLNQRRKKGTSVSHMSPFKAAYMRQHRIEMNWRLNPLRSPRILKGHDDHVITCLQFSGNVVVSGSDDNTLKVWDATTGKCMRTLSGHTGGVWSSQMSDNLIVSGSTDRMLRVWNATTGDCIHTLYGHTSTVRCLHLHGKKVVSGSRDATLRVWDITSGFCEHVLVGHVAAVRCVQYNGKLVVSGAYDYMVKVWNPDREECLHTLQGHTNRVYSLQFDGVHVVSGSLDTSIRVWDVETGHCRHTLMGHQSLTSGMELKNNILISGNADSTVKVWDILTGQCLQTLSGPHKHRSAVTCLQFNNKFVVTSSDDGTVKLWDVKTGDFIRNLVALDSGGSGGVVWRIRASDTKLVCAVGSRNGTEETKLLVLDFDVYEGTNPPPIPK